MKAPIYKTDGKKAGDIDLPERIFGVVYNADLVHQVLSVLRANRRTATAHAKDRSERRGGGAKPWRQKGTGNARHGSRRSPIWRKGGVTHGPRNDKNFTRDIPTKMRRKALYTILSKKYENGRVVFLDSVSMEQPSARDAKQLLEGMANVSGAEEVATRRRNAAFIALPSYDATIAKSFNNFGNVHVDEARNMNALDIAQYKYVIIVDPKASLETLPGATVHS